MKRCLAILVALVSGTELGWGADKASVEARYLSYHTAGKAVVEMVLSKKIEPGVVEQKVKTMVEDAVWMAGEYAKAYTQGAKFLKIVTESVDAMKKLSFAELEHEWHDLHHFEKSGKDVGLDLSAEENEHFTDAVHSIVHPLLVLKAAQSFSSTRSADDLKAMKEEMEEGLEQIEKQKLALLKK